MDTTARSDLHHSGERDTVALINTTGSTGVLLANLLLSRQAQLSRVDHEYESIQPTIIFASTIVWYILLDYCKHGLRLPSSVRIVIAGGAPWTTSVDHGSSSPYHSRVVGKKGFPVSDSVPISNEVRFTG